MTILITADSNHFAAAAARLLLKTVAANQLILMSRKPQAFAEFGRAGCIIRYGDFATAESVEAAACGAERMLLVSDRIHGYTVQQHGSAIDAAVSAGVKLIVYTSHCGSDADNTATVCQDHYDTEQKLMRSGVGWTVLRIGMYADSLTNALLLRALRTGKWFTCSDGGKVSLVDRNDCVACAVVALARPGHENRIYNITGADVWSFRDVADLATEITGKPIDVIDVCVEDFCDYLGSLGISRDPTTQAAKGPFAWSFDDIVSFEKEMRNGKFAIKSSDIRLLTGQAPKSFRSFMFERAQPLRAAAANTDRMKA